MSFPPINWNSPLFQRDPVGHTSSFLTLPEYSLATKVCKTWNRILESNWKSRCQSRYITSLPQGISWKQFLRDLSPKILGPGFYERHLGKVKSTPIPPEFIAKAFDPVPAGKDGELVKDHFTLVYVPPSITFTVDENAPWKLEELLPQRQEILRSGDGRSHWAPQPSQVTPAYPALKSRDCAIELPVQDPDEEMDTSETNTPKREMKLVLDRSKIGLPLSGRQKTLEVPFTPNNLVTIFRTRFPDIFEGFCHESDNLDREEALLPIKDRLISPDWSYQRDPIQDSLQSEDRIWNYDQWINSKWTDEDRIWDDNERINVDRDYLQMVKALGLEIVPTDLRIVFHLLSCTQFQKPLDVYEVTSSTFEQNPLIFLYSWPGDDQTWKPFRLGASTADDFKGAPLNTALMLPAPATAPLEISASEANQDDATLKRKQTAPNNREKEDPKAKRQKL